MKNTGNIISFICAVIAILALAGCIHTYPNGEGVDPTLVKIGVEVTVDLTWEEQSIALTKTSGSQFRLVVEFFRNDKSEGRFEYYPSQEELTAGAINLIMPFDFHAVNYKVGAWLDIVDEETRQNCSYEAANLRAITRSDNHIIWSEDKTCAFACAEINLQQYKDKWGAKVKVPLTLTSPLGRFKIFATDMEEFTDFISEQVSRGEKYSVCVSFLSSMFEAFNAVDNSGEIQLRTSEYYFQFPLSGNEIASGAIFGGDSAMEVELKILIYNSARIIVSKSPPIKFPVERGKITVVTGEMLTDYYTNTINVDNIWDGEIIIEI